MKRRMKESNTMFDEDLAKRAEELFKNYISEISVEETWITKEYAQIHLDDIYKEAKDILGILAKSDSL